jgi:hypothetical protein
MMFMSDTIGIYGTYGGTERINAASIGSKIDRYM